MTSTALFTFANNLALFGWILLLIVPEWKYTRTTIINVAIPLLLSVLYFYLIVVHFGAMQEGGFGSIAELKILFSNDDLILLGWVHYLAFDLFIGTWEYFDAKKNGINRFLIIPCQVLTFLAGPVGLLLYIVLRAIMTKKVIHENF
jgi:hypothetical protein